MSDTRHSKVLIIGSGAAGYTAAVYAARAMLEPVLLTGMQPGGQLTITTDVENYPGFADVIQGPWLMEQMKAQAANVGAVIIDDIATKADLSQRPFQISSDSGATYTADAVIIATGATAKWLGLPSEEKYCKSRCLRLRHLRWFLLPEQRGGGRWRWQHSGRGSALSRQPRLEGDAYSSPR